MPCRERMISADLPVSSGEMPHFAVYISAQRIYKPGGSMQLVESFRSVFESLKMATSEESCGPFLLTPSFYRFGRMPAECPAESSIFLILCQSVEEENKRFFLKRH